MNPITFNFTGSFQTYTFTQAGDYTVTAYGAQGGGSENSIFGIIPTPIEHDSRWVALKALA